MKKEKSKKSTSIDLFLFFRAWFRNQGLYFATSSKSVLIKFTFNLCRSDHNSAARPGVAAGLRADAPGALRTARSVKLYGARSRLYRNEILQVNMRLKALAEIYTNHSFALL